MLKTSLICQIIIERVKNRIETDLIQTNGVVYHIPTLNAWNINNYLLGGVIKINMKNEKISFYYVQDGVKSKFKYTSRNLPTSFIEEFLLAMI
jgi:hypothetical protein